MLMIHFHDTDKIHMKMTIVTEVTIVTSNTLRKINEKSCTKYSILDIIFM